MAAKQLIQEVDRPRFSDLAAVFDFTAGRDLKTMEQLKDIHLTASGKGAIALVLKFLTREGRIADKLDEVLVPDWLGYWVYNQMHTFAFPTKQYSERVKAIFVYHQYGFPQNMDAIMQFAKEKNLVVIEDCAHALQSYYRDKLVGYFGDFSVYSFSKWFFCYALGGVGSKAPGFDDFFQESLKDRHFFLSSFRAGAKLFYEWARFQSFPSVKRSATYGIRMSYSIYESALRPGRAAVNLLEQKLPEEIALRKRRYEYFLRETAGRELRRGLEEKGITPYLIPVFGIRAALEKLVQSLRDIGIATGIHNFDSARNLLSPRYELCVPLPCHSGMSDAQFEKMIK